MGRLNVRTIGIVACLIVAAYTDTASSEPDAFDENVIRANCIEAFQVIEQGRFAEAEALARTSFESAGRNLGPAAPLTRYCRETLGKVYYFGSRFSDAVQLLEPVYYQRLNVLGPFDARTIESAHNLAVAYADAGQFNQSIEIFDFLLERFSDDPARFEGSSILFHQIGKVHLDAGNYELARQYLETSIQLAENETNEYGFSQLRTRGTLSTLYLREQNFEEALSLAEGVFNSFLIEYGETHPDTLTALSTVIAAAINLEEPDVQLLIDDLTILRRRRSMNEQQLASSSDQRRVTVSQTEIAQSIALSYASLDWVDNSDAAVLAANTMLRFKAIGGEYDAALRRLAASQDDEVAELVPNLQRLWPQLEAFELSGQINQANAALNEIGEIERRLAAQSPNFSELLIAPDWNQVSNALPNGSALVEYMIYRPRDFVTGKAALQLHIAAVLLQPSKGPTFASLGVLDEVMDDSIRTLTSLDELQVQPAEIRRASTYLYERLIEPFGDELTGAREIFISPDDILHRIPFGLLTDEGHAELGLERQLRFVPTGRIFKQQQTLENDGRFIAIGGADYGETDPIQLDDRGGNLLLANATTLAELNRVRGGAWGELEGAKLELESLAVLFAESNLFTGKVAEPLIGDRATEAAMRSISGPPMVLHLATHGGATDVEFASNSLSRAILGFSNANRAGQFDGGPTENDGLMRGTDIAQLSLHGTHLVTLSACETGDGVLLRGEGVMSLAFAFRLAGANSVLMTYWRVDDKATVHFMIDFYSAWLDELAADPNASPHRALHLTQQAWALDGEHPRHWAAFALIEASFEQN